MIDTHVPTYTIIDRGEEIKMKARVLIVDDEEINQLYLESFLCKKYEVYTCGSVNSFYLLIDKMNFDIILMDISLHDSKDGIELTRELRQNPKFKNIPILILTSNNSPKTMEEAIDAGANNFFAKPIDGKILTYLVDDYLEMHKIA
jgi:CheY-like chemotaxis protein